MSKPTKEQLQDAINFIKSVQYHEGFNLSELSKTLHAVLNQALESSCYDAENEDEYDYITMSDKQVAALLSEYQEWRRGGDGKQPDPKELGMLIDTAISRLNQIENIGKGIAQMRNETIEECAKVADTWRANQCQLMLEANNFKEQAVCEHSAITAEHLAQAIRNLNKENEDVCTVSKE